MGGVTQKRETLDRYSEVGWVSGTPGNTLTILRLEVVRGRGSVKSHPTHPGLGCALREGTKREGLK